MEITEEDLQQAITSFNDPQAYSSAAQKVFERHAEEMAKGIIQIAKHGATDRVRLDAAKYAIDRVLGRIIDRTADNAGKDEPWSGIFSAVVREPTAEERGWKAQ